MKLLIFLIIFLFASNSHSNNVLAPMAQSKKKSNGKNIRKVRSVSIQDNSIKINDKSSYRVEISGLFVNKFMKFAEVVKKAFYTLGDTAEVSCIGITSEINGKVIFKNIILPKKVLFIRKVVNQSIFHLLYDLSEDKSSQIIIYNRVLSLKSDSKIQPLTNNYLDFMLDHKDQMLDVKNIDFSKLHYKDRFLEQPDFKMMRDEVTQIIKKNGSIKVNTGWDVFSLTENSLFTPNYLRRAEIQAKRQKGKANLCIHNHPDTDFEDFAENLRSHWLERIDFLDDKQYIKSILSGEIPLPLSIEQNLNTEIHFQDVTSLQRKGMKWMGIVKFCTSAFMNDLFAAQFVKLPNTSRKSNKRKPSKKHKISS